MFELRQLTVKERSDDMEMDFICGFTEQQSIVHKTARSNGWWNKPKNEGEIIALIHSELSEALEYLRKGNPKDDKIPEFTGVEAELADVIIRIMDYADGFHYRVAEAVIAKIKHNCGRSYMHGGKKF